MNNPSETLRAHGSDQAILEARARAAAKPLAEQAVVKSAQHLVTFALGRGRYGVEAALVQETRPHGELAWTPVPGTPDFIRGVVATRGRIYSVMDVARFLGLPPRPLPESAHVLLVRNKNAETGVAMELCLLTDDVPQVMQIPETQIQPPTESTAIQAQEYVRGVTAEMLVILDLDKILSDPAIVVDEGAS